MPLHVSFISWARRTVRRSCVAALAVALAVPAHALGSLQLVATIDSPNAFVNGGPVKFQAPPRVLRGRTMLPLRESAALLGLTIDMTADPVRLGRATLDLRAGRALIDTAPQPEDSVALIGGQTYVSVRLLADATGANLSFGPDGRTLMLTVITLPGLDPSAPQARFSTDRGVYAPGERVVYTEYAFDPDGADITARRWTGRQDAYFQPGTYTVTLQVTNARGVQSAPFSRTIRVEGDPVDTPVTYALKYAEPGDTFHDPDILRYPAVLPQPVPGENQPLLFSDSPEVPTQSGLLYQDTISGRARLLAYHLNGLTTPARLYIVARNVDSRPVELSSTRLGETAPTRVEGLLGQVTLMEYFASNGTGRLTLAPGESTPIHVSPVLNPRSGVNVLKDVETTGRVELSFVMLEHTLPPTAEVIQQLPVLPLDGKHQRGTFPGAVRRLTVRLDRLPARLAIGDGDLDPNVQGVDALTGTPMKLAGNYGVLYDLEVSGVSGAVVALSPRGGLYRGAMQLGDGAVRQAIKLPRTGALTRPDQPALLWRAVSDRLRIDFVPASGSNLPINLVFYRPADDVRVARKPYTP